MMSEHQIQKETALKETVTYKSHTIPGPHPKDQGESCNSQIQREGVRSENQSLELASSPLKEGSKSYDGGPSQTRSMKCRGSISTDQTEAHQ